MKGPSFEEGDKVYLVRKNIKTKRPSTKLDFKQIRPFKIAKKISNTNYKLSLPRTIKIHPIFHISLLKPAPKNTKTEQNIKISDNKEFEVERILNHKGEGPQTKYLIK